LKKAMPKKGPILIIEDDLQEQASFKAAFRDAHVFNRLLFFQDGDAAFEYLLNPDEPPFLIFCDVNPPHEDGIHFKKRIDLEPSIRLRCIPFIFYTHYISQYAITEAFRETTVQGFFEKENDYTEFKDVVRIIIDYWKVCKQPM
jgi:CheY-like chemotaxis protein